MLRGSARGAEEVVEAKLIPRKIFSEEPAAVKKEEPAVSSVAESVGDAAGRPQKRK